MKSRFRKKLNLAHKLHRLRFLSPWNIPRVAISKAKRTYFTRQERNALQNVESRREPTRSIRPIRLIHPDVSEAEFASRFTAQFSEAARALVAQANRFVSLEFDLLGSGPVRFTEFAVGKRLQVLGPDGKLTALPDRPQGLIPWHFDFKSGIGWDASTFYADVRFGQIPGMDIKVPWELSRCQHFVALGQAYALTRDEKFTAAFVSQWEDWIEQNPWPCGVNWNSPMDVALRACNWIAAWDFFHASPALPTGFEKKIANALWRHGTHIRRHLEWGADVSTNHYLSNLVGLIYIGLALDERAWIQFGESELRHELLAQTLSDGMDYESSTAYHKLVSEMFLFSAVALSRRRGTQLASVVDQVDSWSEKASERFRRALSFLARINHEGRIPMVGDNDSGHVHVFGLREDFDASMLIWCANVLYGFETHTSRGVPQECVWFFGWQALVQSPTTTPYLSNADCRGLFSLRGSRDVLVFAALPNGTRGVGNHTHNDKLSFNLIIEGEEFFSDPGSGLYTPAPEVRNRLRSVASHSTVQIDDQEQNRFSPQNLFSIDNDARVNIERAEMDVVSASHTGYKRLPGAPVHRRTIRKKADVSWEIEDHLEGSGRHVCSWRFVVSPDIKVSLEEDRVVLSGWRGTVVLSSGGKPFHIETGLFSVSYGSLKQTRILRMDQTADLPLHQTFNITWTQKS